MRGLATWGLALGMLLGAVASAQAVELEGTWHVLIHYRDDASPAPEKWRWEDRIWDFQYRGSRLRWTEYPIVVFKDASGRFERRRGQYARVVHAWEPNAGQLEEIRQGLAVNSRGSKEKTLRGSDVEAWRSAGGPLSASASVVSYSETWSIEGLPDRPVFIREDSLSSGRLKGMAGRTEYRTQAVEEGGSLLTGSYQRDGTRHGSFRMMRSGSVAAVGSRSQSERQREALVQGIQSSPSVRKVLQDELAESLVAGGMFLNEAEIEGLVDEALPMLARGLSEQEIAKRVGQSAGEKYFSFAEPGANHEVSVRYLLPFKPGVPRRLTQGVGEEADPGGVPEFGVFAHQGRYRFAFDFEMPVGSEVVAARDGVVARVVDGFPEGGPRKEFRGRANVITVLHRDGTFAIYAHLSPGASVKPDQEVRAGDVLGRSGTTGTTADPHLHFAVMRINGRGELETVPIRFAGESAEGFVPSSGLSYGGGAAEAAKASSPLEAQR